MNLISWINLALRVDSNLERQKPYASAVPYPQAASRNLAPVSQMPASVNYRTEFPEVYGAPCYKSLPSYHSEPPPLPLYMRPTPDVKPILGRKAALPPDLPEPRVSPFEKDLTDALIGLRMGRAQAKELAARTALEGLDLKFEDLFRLAMRRK